MGSRPVRSHFGVAGSNQAGGNNQVGRRTTPPATPAPPPRPNLSSPPATAGACAPPHTHTHSALPAQALGSQGGSCLSRASTATRWFNWCLPSTRASARWTWGASQGCTTQRPSCRCAALSGAGVLGRAGAAVAASTQLRASRCGRCQQDAAGRNAARVVHLWPPASPLCTQVPVPVVLRCAAVGA